MDRKTRRVLGDLAEAATVVLVLGVIVAFIYRWFTGELPWWFIAGEALGGLLGFTLLVSTMPRRY
jgi:hypothetical protein